MSTNENGEIAARILNKTLAEVRETRTRRRIRKIALGSGALAMLALSFALRQKPLAPTTPEPSSPSIASRLPADETLVVMVWHNGAARLEEYDSEKIGAMDLQFSLEPVIACPEGEWLKSF